jgi:hypothetical protein
MKTLKMVRFQSYLSILLLTLTMGFFTACEDDEVPTPVAVTTIAPTSGVIGTEVTITGTSFSTVLAENTVKFGSVTATVTEATATTLKAKVPAGASTNPIIVSVTKGGVTTTVASFNNFTVTAKPIIEVSGTLAGVVNWTKDNVYKLKSFVRVGADDGTADNAQATATLNIEAGTLIIGERSSKGTLVVQRGSKINAIGTAAEPIVFTSERPIGSREPGDWGGVVICGYGDNNSPGTPGKIFTLEGNYGGFSGGRGNPRNDDNSGTLKFVRIEYAGIAINPNQEVNSLTLGAVGSGTTIENVQCSFGLDDAFEWFGGAVNCKNLIAYRCLDDDFDVDFGYSGNVQFALAIRGASLADQSGSNGFEVDNDGSGNTNAPFTSATFSNVSVFGPKAIRETAISLQFQNALHLRRSNKIKIHNSFFTGFPNGILIDGPSTVTYAGNGELVLKNNVLAGVDNWGGNGFGLAGTVFGAGTTANGANHPVAPRGFRISATSTALTGSNFSNGVWTFTAADIPTTPDPQTPEAWFAANNTIINGWNSTGSNLNLNANIFEIGTPTLLPGAGSVLLTGGSTTGLPTFFTSVTYKGAFGATDWTTGGWVEWNPAVKNYGF